MTNDIIDNKNTKLVDVLKEKLSISKTASFAVGWLFLSGFKELKEQLDQLEHLNILAGAKTNKQTAEILMLEKKYCEAVEDELADNRYQTPEQRQSILDNEFNELVSDISHLNPAEENRDFIKWLWEKLRDGKISIEIYTKEILHSKLYLFEYKDKRYGKGEAIIGSSNFSLSGFDLNTELNVKVLGDENYDKLNQWFGDLWKDGEKTDFTVLATQALEKSWPLNKEITPFRVYLKVLSEIFENTDQKIELNLPDKVPLFDFQKDAVRLAYEKLQKYNGILLADVPGLGKTFMGAALLAHLESEGKNAIVVAPPKLKSYWEDTLSDFGVAKTKVFSSGKLEEILEDTRQISKQIVLIDESHHFRNPDTKDYLDMSKICEGKQVILLSATPQNLSIWDLYYQIKLFTPYEINHNFKISPIGLKDYFKACEKGTSNIDDIISEIVIRRTRTEIKEDYFEKIKFPVRMGPYRIDYSIDEVYDGGLYQQINTQLGELTYARYDLGKYLNIGEDRPEQLRSQIIAWDNLRRLVRINFNRRLESSIQAFRDTIDKNIKACETFQWFINEKNKIPIGEVGEIEDLQESIENGEEEDITELEKEHDVMGVEQFDVEKLKAGLQKDIDIFTQIQNSIADIQSQDDDKLSRLVKILNSPEIKGKKIIIFSYFTSTVKYLYENLKDQFDRVDYVYGGEDLIAKIKKFAPKANHSNIDPKDETQILITTEVLSEGINLQDGQVIINYELHWNPVRMIQRIGRIDRIGSENDTIYVYNFFPETAADKHIGIQKAVTKRIEDIINNFGGDEKTISLDDPEKRKKLYEIYTENNDTLDEVEQSSIPRHYERAYNRFKQLYSNEYNIAINLPDLANIAKKSGSSQGIVAFCRADDYFRLRYTDISTLIVDTNDWKALQMLECEQNEPGYTYNPKLLVTLDNIKNNFEEELAVREKDKSTYRDPYKSEFLKFVTYIKHGQVNTIKNRCDILLNLIDRKPLNFSNGKLVHNLVRREKSKYGFTTEQILNEIEPKLFELLGNLKDQPAPPIKKQYAQVIIAEELK